MASTGPLDSGLGWLGLRSAPKGGENLWFLQCLAIGAPYTPSSRAWIGNEPVAELELTLHCGVESGHALEDRSFCQGTYRRLWRRRPAGPAVQLPSLK